jgi:hypothetical protein
MRWLGMMGMTRRDYTYVPGLGWDHANLAATISAFVILLGRWRGSSPWQAPISPSAIRYPPR